METSGYVNLKKSMENKELKLYLVSHPKYRTNSIRGANLMNDFYDIACSLNEYGAENPGFDMFLRSNILDILKENKLFYTYSVVNIISEQIDLEEERKNKINFINEELLNLLKMLLMIKK